MKTVHKYTLPIVDLPPVLMPLGAQIVHVGPDPTGTPCIWALVDTECTLTEHRFVLVGTGRELAATAGAHVATFIWGRLVLHLFHEAPPTRPEKTATGAELIAAERARQLFVEGWTPGHDAAHTNGSLAAAAVAYARYGDDPKFAHYPPGCWPWDPKWWKPAGRIRSLVKAGALIAAEIDRILQP